MKKIQAKTIGLLTTLCGIVLGLLGFSSCRKKSIDVQQPQIDQRTDIMVMYGPPPAKYRNIEVESVETDSTQNNISNPEDSSNL